MKRFLVGMLLLFVVNMANACCVGTEASFTITDYDLYENILEVTVLDADIFDFAAEQKKYEEILANLSGNEDLPEVPNLDGLSRFNAKVLNVFKGDVNAPKIELTSVSGLSIAWEPEVGQTYILYLGEKEIVNGTTTFNVTACHRKNSPAWSFYETEKQALEFFKQPKNGKFQITNQENAKSNRFVTLKGAFKNGQRHGKWKVYSLDYDSTNKPKLAYTLYYKNGQFIKIKYTKSVDEGFFIGHTRELYDSGK